MTFSGFVLDIFGCRQLICKIIQLILLLYLHLTQIISKPSPNAEKVTRIYSINTRTLAWPVHSTLWQCSLVWWVVREFCENCDKTLLSASLTCDFWLFPNLKRIQIYWYPAKRDCIIENLKRKCFQQWLHRLTRSIASQERVLRGWEHLSVTG